MDYTTTLDDQFYDVAVIGGGIIGASAANHLTAAGYTVLLLERGDFAGATTGRTSRLQYSGLSYLASCQSAVQIIKHPKHALEGLLLARDAMQDRSRFIRRVPERVRPITCFLPIYRGSALSMHRMMLGLKVAQALDFGGVPLNIRKFSAEQARQHPAVGLVRDQDQLAGAICFVEHQFAWPERICVDTVFNAQQNGAHIENYTPVEQIERQADDSWRIQARDARHNAPRVYRARTIVNCAGAWVDDIASRSSLRMPRLTLGLKGVNVAARLPDAFRGIAFESLTRSGESFYVFPWGELHYFGPCNRALDQADGGYSVSEDEIGYILSEFNHLFPTVGLTRAQILYSWAGVRPRTFHPGLHHGSETSVVHDLAEQGGRGYFAYTGGLLMTHRKAGREIVRAVDRRHRPTASPKPMLDSVRLFPRSDESASLLEPPPRYACAREKVYTLEDLLRRRISAGWNEALGCDVAYENAMEVRAEMGWSVAQAEAEVRNYQQATRKTFGLREFTA